MAIGNTIDVSVPTVGTTVESFTRSTGNTFYTGSYTIGGSDYPATISLRSADPFGSSRQFGGTMRLNLAYADDPGTLTKGAVTVSLNVQCRPGTVLGKSQIAAAVRHQLSAFLKAGLIEDLYEGVAL